MEEVAQETGYSIDEIKIIIKSFIGRIKYHLLKKQIVNLTGFATFEVKEVSAKKTWNFKEKKSVMLPTRYLPKSEFRRKFIDEVKNINA
jgi:nucleoid DNA-binding protein